jgi:hypothetical protein
MIHKANPSCFSRALVKVVMGLDVPKSIMNLPTRPVNCGLPSRTDYLPQQPPPRKNNKTTTTARIITHSIKIVLSPARAWG